MAQMTTVFTDEYLEGVGAVVTSAAVRVEGNKATASVLIKNMGGTSPRLTIKIQGSYDERGWFDPASNSINTDDDFGEASVSVSSFDFAFARIEASLPSGTDPTALFDGFIVTSKQ